MSSSETRGARIRSRLAGGPLALAAIGLLALTGAAAAEAATLTGSVKSANEPIKRAPVTLFKTTVNRTGPVAIGQDRTDRNGRFSLNYGTPGRANSVLYVVSGVPNTRRRRAVRLATVLGAAPYPRSVSLNERTTVAAGFTEA